jgi:putative heme iron utilization protein
MTKELLSDVARSAHDFIRRQKSLQIATVNSTGLPLASYAPFYRDKDGYFYILVSDLSTHTANLLNGKANILILEDESECRQIYARTRLNFPCSVFTIERQSKQYYELINHLHNCHGDIISTISALSDFHLLQLIPDEGVYVRGFGQAYTIDSTLTTVVPIIPN